MSPSSKPIISSPRTHNRLLSFYIASLTSRPLLTKSLTSAGLSFLQEILASRIAAAEPDVTPTGLSAIDYIQSIGVDARVLKLTAYGGLIAGPLNHFLMKILHKSFPNHQSAKSKLGMILVSTLLISPIQNSVFLVTMAAINGAKSVQEIKFFWKRAILTLTKISCIIGPTATLFANRFLAPELWVPFFNMIGFVLGTYFNQLAKKKQLKRDPGKKLSKKPQRAQGDDDQDEDEQKRRHSDRPYA